MTICFLGHLFSCSKTRIPIISTLGASFYKRLPKMPTCSFHMWWHLQYIWLPTEINSDISDMYWGACSEARLSPVSPNQFRAAFGPNVCDIVIGFSHGWSSSLAARCPFAVFFRWLLLDWDRGVLAQKRLLSNWDYGIPHNTIDITPKAK